MCIWLWYCPMMLLKGVKIKSLWIYSSYSKIQTSVYLGHWELEIIYSTGMPYLTCWTMEVALGWGKFMKTNRIFNMMLIVKWLRSSGISFLANTLFNDGHKKLNTGFLWSILFFFLSWDPTVLTALSCLLQWQQTEECWRSKDNTAARDIRCRPHKLQTPLEISWTCSI